MPRTPRSPETVDIFRQNILDAALNIIVESGFENLSMRKLAAKLDITATTLYNYYMSKDDLYFYIRMHGFELLYDCLDRACASHDRPLDRIRAAVEAYLRFGFQNMDYYEVMFLSRSVPKFLDCVGTPLEEVARREKNISIQPLFLVAEKLAELPDSYGSDPRYQAVRLWTELNGIVSLHNSRLLREVEDDVDGLVSRLASDICERFVE